MRLSKHEIRQRINGNLSIEFASQDITSYSGLELLQKYFRLIGLYSRLRQALSAYQVRGDYSLVDYIMILMTLWLTGGRRLSHLPYFADDPLTKRFCGLKSFPHERTVARGMKQFIYDSLQTLVQLNSELVLEKVESMDLCRVTLDFDGTVISCGNQVRMAARGYNPHKRYAKSYYPLLAHIAQTGHFLHVENRPGNVHDSKGGALEIMESCLEKVRAFLGNVLLEVRLDSAFFQEDIVDYLDTKGVEYAIKVPLWNHGSLKPAINARQRWHRVSSELSWFRHRLYIKKWQRHVDVVIYRKRLSKKKQGQCMQLDLFCPDDGVYEYCAICSNKNLHPKSLLDFFNGRCAMEHQISELKQEFGFDAVPTQSFEANSAHQQISILCYNLIRNFQMDTNQTKVRKRTGKRTNLFIFQSLKTLRFKFISQAGRLLKLSSGQTLRLNDNVTVMKHYSQIQTALNKIEKIAA